MTNTANDPRPQAWYEARADYLATFMTEQRRRTLEEALARRTHRMTLLAENTFHPHNASALMRHCDAFGVQELHTVESRCPFSPNAAIVRGSDKWIDLRRHASTADALAALRAEGYRIVATTPHRESCTPETFDVARGPFALVLGTEHAGISQEVVDAADEFLRIPMCGLVESLNVSASAAILIYTLSARLRTQLPPEEWMLRPAEAAAVRYRWMCRSVRDARRILSRRFGDEIPAADIRTGTPPQPHTGSDTAPVAADPHAAADAAGTPAPGRHSDDASH